jgi:hypothetical protein
MGDARDCINHERDGRDDRAQSSGLSLTGAELGRRLLKIAGLGNSWFMVVSSKGKGPPEATLF